MSIALRVLLIAGAILILVFVLTKIRKSQLYTNDAVFWFIFSACLLIIAVFPQIISWLSDLIGIESPSNFVFLVIIAILLIRTLMTSVEIARMRLKFNQLVQHEALEDAERRKD